MVGWLSGFRAQTAHVAYWENATFDGRLGQAAAPGGGLTQAYTVALFRAQKQPFSGPRSVVPTDHRSVYSDQSEDSLF